MSSDSTAMPSTHTRRGPGSRSARLRALFILYRARALPVYGWFLTLIALGVIFRVTESWVGLMMMVGPLFVPIFSQGSQTPDKDFERLLPVTPPELFGLRYLTGLLPLLLPTGCILLIRNTGAVAELWSLVATGPLATPAAPWSSGEIPCVLLAVATAYNLVVSLGFARKIEFGNMVGSFLMGAGAAAGIWIMMQDPIALKVMGVGFALVFNGLLAHTAWLRLIARDHLEFPVEPTRISTRTVTAAAELPVEEIARPTRTELEFECAAAPQVRPGSSPALWRALFAYTYGEARSWWLLGLGLYLVLPLILPYAGVIIPVLIVMGMALWMHLHPTMAGAGREEFGLLLPVSRDQLYRVQIAPILVALLLSGMWSAWIGGVVNLPGMIWGSSPPDAMTLVLMAFGPAAAAGILGLMRGYPRVRGFFGFLGVIPVFAPWLAKKLTPDSLALLLLGIMAGGFVLGQIGFRRKQIDLPHPLLGLFGKVR